MSRPHVPAVARHLLLVLATVPALALAQSSPAISTIVAFSNSAVNAGPVRGPDGALYGTTSTVTAVTGGLIYRAAADGSSVRTLYQLKLTDGLNPLGGLLLGSDGLLYGVTSSGPLTEANTAGTVFRIAPDGSGFTIIYRFKNFSKSRFHYSSPCNLSVLYSTHGRNQLGPLMLFCVLQATYLLYHSSYLG